MAGKKVKLNAGAVSVTPRFPKFVGYVDCVLGTPVTLRVRNDGAEPLTLTVSLENSDGLLVAFEKEVEVPFESAVDIEAREVFSPVYLSACDEAHDSEVVITVRHAGKEIVCETERITVLPFDYWEGLEGNAERVVSFVRPRISDCARVLAEAGKRLKKWKLDGEFYGYTGTDKNTVRQIAAAIHAAIKSFSIEREEDTPLDAPVCAFRDGVLKDKRSSPFRLAVFTAACFEAAHLNPVIAIGKRGIGVGVWLYESCFLDPVTDDGEIVGKYVSEGINNLSIFDVDDLFADRSAAITPSEAHFKAKLKENYFDLFVDVRRCRIGGMPVCPLRGKGLHGYELTREEEMSDESAPTLPTLRKLHLDGKQPKNKQWERRLLDLTAKNPLLNFTGRNALHIGEAGADELCTRLSERGGMKLRAGAAKMAPFGEELSSQQKELILLEQKKGFLRTDADSKTVAEIGARLFKRNREAGEETGAKVLYLALGFLKYVDKESGKPQYAPLVLVPVELRRGKGGDAFTVEGTEQEYFVNSTLLEFLKQVFNIDVRGLGNDVSALKLTEIFAMVRAETASMKGWDVVTDAYLAAFSFQNYLMWNDIHSHFDELQKNATVSALLTGRMMREEAVAPAEEDDADPMSALLPLLADSSQYSAVALSGTGNSFVLHGPPGTGKSQTITNIISNALYEGKKVLFVAEKKAALDVVKKRLDGIGIGDFCLELHSNKTNKGDVMRRMERTLGLVKTEEVSEFEARAQEIEALRDELKAPMAALHKKRRLGISVYEAILGYLANRTAPDVIDIESAFYDSLAEQRLSECRRMILAAAAAAKECGGVVSSPFENVNLTEYSTELRDRIFCSSEVLIAEIRHLKAFLGLFLEFYRQKLSTVTRRKIDSLSEIARRLSRGDCDRYFAGVKEDEFYTFFNANRRLDRCLEYYYKHFKSLVDGEDLEELRKYCEVGGDWKLNRTAKNVVKKLSRVALHEIPDEDYPRFLQTVVEIGEAEERIAQCPALAKNFSDRGGKINYKKRTEYLEGLNSLHELCAATFLEFNPDSFNGMCIRATNGYTMPVLEGLLKATESFSAAQESFLSFTNADRNKLKEEDILDYYSSKAGALIDNVDMLPNWCMYRATAEKLAALGLNFIPDALESGRLKTENVLMSFEKNVYKNFLEINIPADANLSRLTVGTLEETIEKFRLSWDEFVRLTRDRIRARLLSRLPDPEESALSVEIAAFTRLLKSNLRGTGLRGMFAEVPTLASRLAPCLLMSPTTVAQYLQPKADIFDLVIFDEASQMSTAEAVGSIARAKAAIVVGDPKQLPPTVFFHSSYVDEDDLESEDLESVLDDCLALGMAERHLKWHYRSKHESLIAFSNSMYYSSRLCTFPSPDGLESRVKLVKVDGTYDRGFTKRNRKEAEALVREVVRRLQDPVLSRSSMGVVTFSSAQQEDIEKLLSKEIASKRLESVAYEREEPLFVKNLENVQGDERDVILFSVCYGPDSLGRVSLNFGPLNQTGGWRRLNVAVSRAREEMLIFSTMTASMIDLSKTSSKGVAGLKAFLEFAEKGRTTLAVNSDTVRRNAGIGKYIAQELAGYGYECRCDVGASDFKIDVCVIDPKNRHRFLLGIICDGTDLFSVKDRSILQVQTLKRANWNVMRINCVNYYNNPKREIKRIKETLDRLSGADKKAGAWMSKNARTYKFVKPTANETSAFITGGEHDGEIMARIREIVAVEEPISRTFLKKRTMGSFGIAKSGSKVDARLDSLIDACALPHERAAGAEYFYKHPAAITIAKFRTEPTPALRKSEEDFTVYEMLSLIRGVLEERVALYMDELVTLILGVYRDVKGTERFAGFLRDCVAYGEELGILVRSVSDRISLA